MPARKYERESRILKSRLGLALTRLGTGRSPRRAEQESASLRKYDDEIKRVMALRDKFSPQT